MKRKPNYATFIVFAFAALAACSRARAYHSSEFYDCTSPVGFLNATVAGGICLGQSPNQSLNYYGLDTLPARNAVTGQIDRSSRVVLLSFDIVNPLASIVAGNFVVTAKNHYHFPPVYEPMTISSTVFNDSVQLFFESHSYSTSFVYQGINAAAQGLELEFSFASFVTQGTWGLDNVRIDWGQPVPEPSPLFLFAIGAIRLLGFRRTRH
jgi:hypothetical protein